MNLQGKDKRAGAIRGLIQMIRSIFKECRHTAVSFPVTQPSSERITHWLSQENTHFRYFCKTGTISKVLS